MLPRWSVSIARVNTILILVLSLSACGSTSNQRADLEADLQQAAHDNTVMGGEYMRRGQYEVALDKLNKALAFDPQYALAHTVLANLYEILGDTGNADAHHRKAVKFAPESGDIQNNYGVFLCKQGKALQGEQHFLAALQDPFYQTPEGANANAGSCLLNIDEFDRAETYLRKALQLNAKFADALLPMATLFYRQQDYIRARAFLQRYEAVAKHGPDSLLLAHRIETGIGSEADAERYKNIIIKNYPGTPQAKYFNKGSEQ